MNIKDFKWTEKRFGTRFANILKKLGGVSKDSTDGSIEYKDEQGNVTKLVTDSTFSSLLAKNGLIEVKWQELKDKRDNGQLIPGSLYRIIDYNCTTTQENTRSTGHQFDIVLLALSENKLAEEGWAMMHDNIYDVTYTPDVGQEPVTAKGYLYNYLSPEEPEYSIVLCDTLKGSSGLDGSEFTIDEENKTIVFNSDFYASMNVENLPYNYFQNSNLSAWKVWYCLDNDTTRFAWADDSVDEDSPATMVITGGKEDISTTRNPTDDMIVDNIQYYAWKIDGHTYNYYTLSQTLETGDDTFEYNLQTSEMVEYLPVKSYTPAHEGTGLPNGRGVIYRLIDEWNNDVPYDFKNIQQLLPLVDEIEYDEDEGVNTWVYTLDVYDLINQTHLDASIYGNKMKDLDEDFVRGVTNNLIEPSFIVGSDNPIQCLGKTAMIVSTNDEGSFAGMSSNSIKKYNGNNIPTRILTNCYGCTILENVTFAIFIQCDYCILCNGSATNRVEQSQLIYKILNQSYKWYITKITGADNLTSFATMRDIGDIETLLNNI